jgi:cytochrome P450
VAKFLFCLNELRALRAFRPWVRRRAARREAIEVLQRIMEGRRKVWVVVEAIYLVDDEDYRDAFMQFLDDLLALR